MNIFKNIKWATVIKILLIVTSALEILQIWKLYQEPQLAQLFMVAMLLLFVGTFAYGYHSIKQVDKGKVPKFRMGKITYTLLVVLMIGCLIAYTVLFFLRPTVSDKINSDSYEIKNEQGYQVMKSFHVNYPDNYYLSLKIDNQYPVTIQLVDQKGNEIFNNMAMRMDRKAIKMKLNQGTYELRVSFASGKYQKSKVNITYGMH
jgi:phosphate/sulfate permease